MIYSAFVENAVNDVTTEKTGRNLHVLAVSAFLAGLCTSTIQAVWQPFALSLGAPMSTLGLLESLGGRLGLMASLVQPVGGWFSDRVGRKPVIALGSVMGFFAIALYILAAVTGDWRILVPGIIILGGSLITWAPENSMIAESVPISQRGAAYSLVTFSWVVPGILAPTLGGFIADHWGFTAVFGIRMGLEIVRLVCIVGFLKETLGQVTQAQWIELKQVLGRILTPPRGLRGLYGALTVDLFAWGLGSTILPGLLSKTYGFTPFQLGVMASLSSLGWALAQLPMGRLIARFGCKVFLLISEIGGLFVVGSWLLVRSFEAYAFIHVLYGVIAAIWVPAQLTLLVNSVSPGERGEAMGRLSAFRGLLGFPASYLGGLLYDLFGFQAPILANVVGIICATTAIFVFVQEPSPHR